MTFNSITYLLFLPLVYLVFSFAGDRARPFVLLAASLLFYAALKVPYLPVVLILVAVANYGIGIRLEQSGTPGARCVWLWGGIATNILVLAVLKYLPFICENLEALPPFFRLGAHMLPAASFVAIGVSYYIFQAMSYLFDIYLEKETAERHFGYFALYLSFFPKLLQGPIERAGDLIPQLKSRYRFSYLSMRSGILLFTWGIFKKTVIADRLGLYVDYVYHDPHAFSGLSLLLATYLYAFQIYLDFSGYTDMALGSARLFNIELTQNFNSPYLATSAADFWRRWHITFSRWILDYIFKPLQMQWRDRKNWGTAAALMAAFLVSGVWHGARWGFVIWGGLHGLYMAASVFYRPYQKRLHKALRVEKTRVLRVWQVFVTFNLVSFAWIFFRAADVADAAYVVTNLFCGVQGVGLIVWSQGGLQLSILFSSLLVYFVTTQCMVSTRVATILDENVVVRRTAYYCFVLTILAFFETGSSEFIYFKF